jgi:DNA-nicking Smr family endonuclease
VKTFPVKRAPRTIPGSTGDILSFLDRHGTQDKDAVAAKGAKAAKKPVEKGKGGALRMTLDLHGRTSDEASRQLRSTLEWCRLHGIRELLIVHGQGRHSAPEDGPVLKNLVRDMLDCELRLQVKEYRTALPRDGGDGATVVFLC